MTKKTQAYTVRLHEEEADAFDNCAKKLSITRSKLMRGFVRYFINNEPDLQSDEKDNFRDAVYQLSRYVVSLNQITAAINSGKITSIDDAMPVINETMKQVEQLRQQMNSYIMKSSRRWVKPIEMDD